MELNKQVCSLELSKRLNELRVNQESLFSWFHRWEGSSLDDAGRDFLKPSKYESDNSRLVASAFSTAELGELLPWRVKVNGRYFFLSFGGRENPERLNFYPGYEVSYSYGENCIFLERASTEADARAKMLARLLESSIIS